MNSIAILQISSTDPHGIIITVVSVLVVFVCLAILHISYYLIGRVIRWHADWTAKKEETPAHATATEEQNIPHDQESYTITIKRKGQYETTRAPRISFMTPDRPQKETAVSNHIESPLDGNILSVCVKVGDKVKIGQPVAILEAMKMENEIQAEAEGTVTAVSVQKGDHVALGDHIITIG